MADIKISELTALASMTDTALVPVVDGAATKKITGSNLKTYFLNGNSATVTNGVYTTGDQTIGGTKTFSNNIVGNVTGNVTGNAGTVTNGVVTTGSYADPGWITSLSYTKVVTPATVIRAQRTSGGTSTTTGKWTFTTVSGSATAEWVADGSIAYPALGLASSPYIIFTFTGFTKLPISAYRLGVTGSSPGLTNRDLGLEIVTNKTSPNVLTAFDPSVHKYAFVEGSSIAEDIYWEFRQ